MPLSVEATRWRDACRRAVERQQDLLATSGSPERRREQTSVGAGGDLTLAIDRDFEAIALAELQAVSDSAFVVSEEAGEIAPEAGSSRDWVVLDPIDGSTNVANSLPQFSLSVAIASGPTMADVWFGYVFDFGAREEFVCERDAELELDGRPVEYAAPASRLVGCESAEPRLLAAGLDRVADAGVKEIRVVGSIAISLCYVALGRLDGLVTCKQCRSVDAAAGQLMAASTGAEVLFDGEPPLSAGLALSERYRVVAGRGDLAPALLDAQRMIPLVPR